MKPDDVKLEINVAERLSHSKLHTGAVILYLYLRTWSNNKARIANRGWRLIMEDLNMTKASLSRAKKALIKYKMIEALKGEDDYYTTYKIVDIPVNSKFTYEDKDGSFINPFTVLDRADVLQINNKKLSALALKIALILQCMRKLKNLDEAELQEIVQYKNDRLCRICKAIGELRTHGVLVSYCIDGFENLCKPKI